MAIQTGTLKAGSQLVIDSIGSPVDYDVSVTGYAVDFKRIQQKNTLSLGPYKVDCSYSVTINSGSPSIYKVQPNGQREYTAATLPDPASLPVVSELIIDNIRVKSSSGGLLVREAGTLYPLQPLGLMRSRAGCEFRKDLLSQGAASSSTAKTYEQISLAKRKPIAFRVVYKHNVSSGTHTPIQVCVGSKALGNSATTSNIVNVTWSGAATPTFTLTSGGLANNFNISDLIPISVVDRTDGYSGYIIAARSLIPIDAGLGKFSYSLLAAQATSPGSVMSLTGDRIVGCAEQAGDFVTTNQAGFTAVSTTTIRLLDFIFYYEDGTSDVFMGCGDSITSGEWGALGTGGNMGWTRQVVTGLNVAGINVDYANIATGSMPSASYLGMAKQMVPVIKPKVASFAMITPNDYDTVSIAVSKMQVIDFIELCLANGVTPVITTPCPRNDTPANEASIRSKMVQARDWLLGTVNGAWGIPVVDIAIATGLDGDLTRFAAGFAAADGVNGIHPNDAGYTAIANAALPVIKPLFYV